MPTVPPKQSLPDSSSPTRTIGIDIELAAGQKKAANAALAKLRKDLREAEKSHQESAMGDIFLRMARITGGQREYLDTIKLLGEAKTLFESMNNDVGLAFVYHELALCNREMQRNSLALEYAHKAAQIFRDKQMNEELAWLYNEMSIVYLNMSRLEESLNHAKKARALFSDLKIKEGLLWNSCHMGSLHGEMGLYTEARDYFEEAVKISKESKNNQGLAWSLLWLGRIYKELEQLDVADEHLAKAKVLFLHLGLKDRVGFCLLHEAAIQRTKGAPKAALEANREAIHYFSPTRHHDGVAWALIQTGQVYRDQGQYMKAWQTFREALNLHMDVANRKGIAWAENELGRTYMELNDLSHARESFLKATGIAQQLDIVPLKAELDRNMQGLLLEEGRLGDSERIARETDKNVKGLRLADLRVESLMERARYSILTGSLDQAQEQIKDAGALAESSQIGRLNPLLSVFQGEVLARQGRDEEEADVLEKAMALAEKMDQPQVKTQALLGLVQFRCFKNNLRSLEDMLDEAAKSIRIYGWRRLKAKYLAVRAIFDYRSKKEIDHRVFDQIQHILETAELATSHLEMLRLHKYFYKKAGFERESREADDAARALLKRGPSDLKKIKSREESLDAFPVSLII